MSDSFWVFILVDNSSRLLAMPFRESDRGRGTRPRDMTETGVRTSKRLQRLRTGGWHDIGEPMSSRCAQCFCLINSMHFFFDDFAFSPLPSFRLPHLPTLLLSIIAVITQWRPCLGSHRFQSIRFSHKLRTFGD